MIAEEMNEIGEAYARIDELGISFLVPGDKKFWVIERDEKDHYSYSNDTFSAAGYGKIKVQIERLLRLKEVLRTAGTLPVRDIFNDSYVGQENEHIATRIHFCARATFDPYVMGRLPGAD